MKVYDTLIIGSCYFSAGYAAANPRTVICEEHQICDTSFYLPMRSFRHTPYSPITEEGATLLHRFHALSLFRGNEQNTNGFEFAFCQYIAEKKPELLLKCRVIHIKQQTDGIYDVTVQTNHGLEHLFAEKILDTTDRSDQKHFTVLFVCDDIQKAKDKLLAAFNGAQIEPAFYKGRYALHMAVGNTDENRIKLGVYKTWCSLDTDAKILYMAPVFYGAPSPIATCDSHYDNPIRAFEAGYFYAKETDK